MKKNKKNKGFTLIELMVVISIIALLSSVVLASLKEVRDKAIAQKFKSEMQQFISALELYRTNVGNYPYEGLNSGISPRWGKLNNDSSSSNIATSLETFLVPKYLSKLPSVPKNSYTQTSSAWFFYVNNTVQNSYKVACADDVTIPKYYILFWSFNPLIYNMYSDLPNAKSTTDEGLSFIPVASVVRCFSIK